MAATWVCTVTSSGSPFPLARGPRDVPLSASEGAVLPSGPELEGESSAPHATVRLWEVSAAAVSGPTGEVVKFVFLEESFLPLASAASVCGMKFSGASEEVWLFLGV